MIITVIPEYSNNGGGTFTFLLKFIKINISIKNKIFLVIERNRNFKTIQKLIFDYNLDLIIIPTRKRLFYKPYFCVLYELWIWLIYIKKIKSDLLIVSSGTPWINLGYVTVVKKMIYFLHTYPVSRFRWKSAIMQLLFKFLSEKKCIATVSNYSAEQISKYAGVEKNCIHVIYNSYDKKYDLLNKENNISPVVLTVGHVVYYKSPELWIEVALKVKKQIPDVQFWWVGDGELLDSMRAKVSDLALQNNIKYLGHSDNVTEYYLKASVYFQPSKIESHGIAVVEAMSLGIPCVVSNVGGMIESVADKINGFVCDVDDTDCFADCIIILLKNKALSKNIGELAKKYTKENFNELVQKNKILDLLNTVYLK